jgi:hypothetical protein
LEIAGLGRGALPYRQSQREPWEWDLKGRSQRDGDQDHYTPREHGQPGDNGHRLADWQALLGFG